MKVLLQLITITLCSITLVVGQQKISNGFAHERGKKIDLMIYNPVPDGEIYTNAVAVGDDIEIWVAGTPMKKHVFAKTGHKEVYEMAYTPDGKYLISVGKDKTIRVWDVVTFKKVKDLSGHFDEIHALSVDPKGKYFATASEDKMVKLWSLSDFTEINTFFNHKSPAFDVSFSNDGKLLASLGEDKKVVVRELPLGVVSKEIGFGTEAPLAISFAVADKNLMVGGEDGTLRLYDFDKSGNVSSLIHENKGELQEIAYSYDGKYAITGFDNSEYIVWDLKNLIMYDKGEFKGDLNSLEFSPNGKQLAATGDEKNYYDVAFMGIKPRQMINSSDNASPQVVLTSPRFKGSIYSTDMSRVQIAGLVTDDESGVYSLKVNGADAYTGNDEFSIQVDLKFGINPIQVEARDAAGNVRMIEYKFKREDLGGDGLDNFFVESSNHLLIIAADKYQHWNPLSNAVSDAEKVKKVLQAKYGFKEENTRVITNDGVTREGVINAFTEMVKKVKPSDNLLIYYSGHGDFDTVIKEGYWVPVDGKEGERHTYLSNSELKKYIKAVNSRHTFLIADACFSGSLFESGSRGNFIDNMEKLKSRWGLTAGSLEEVSDGQSGKASPFCNALLEYLNTPPEEEFVVSDLVRFVKRKVADQTKQQPQGNPLSGVGDEGGQFVFRKSSGF